MAVAILLIGVGAGGILSVAAWSVSASLLLAALAYPLGGTIGCFLAGLGLYQCRRRVEAVQH